MRRILLICVSAAALLLAAASAGGAARASHGFLVVRNAMSDGGRPVVTVVVQGFVLGRVTREARVDIYRLPSAAPPQVVGPDVSRRHIRWRSLAGTEFSGSDFRFRAVGGPYRVVIRGAGVSVFAGGHGNARLHGSSVYPRSDGLYSFDGAAFRSLPTQPLFRTIGKG